MEAVQPQSRAILHAEEGSPVQRDWNIAWTHGGGVSSGLETLLVVFLSPSRRNGCRTMYAVDTSSLKDHQRVTIRPWVWLSRECVERCDFDEEGCLCCPLVWSVGIAAVAISSTSASFVNYVAAVVSAPKWQALDVTRASIGRGNPCTDDSRLDVVGEFAQKSRRTNCGV